MHNELPTTSTIGLAVSGFSEGWPVDWCGGIGEALSSCVGLCDAKEVCPFRDVSGRVRIEEVLSGPYLKNSGGIFSLYYLFVLTVLFILICVGLTRLLDGDDSIASMPRVAGLRRHSSTEAGTTGESLARFSSESQRVIKSFHTQSTYDGVASSKLSNFASSRFSDSKTENTFANQSSILLLQRWKEIYKEKQNGHLDSPTSSDDIGAEMFLDNGRFKHNFTRATPVGVENSLVYKALHRFEGKWYAIKKIPLNVSLGDSVAKPSAFKAISRLTELVHPNLLSYITCWAEKFKSQTNSRTQAASSRRERLLSEYIENSSDASMSESPEKPTFVDDTRVQPQRSHILPSAQQCLLNFFIQQEYNNGVSLKNTMKKEKLTNVEIFFVFNEVLKGLSYLHSNSVAHGDLKPSKIIINGDQVKLADFGLDHDLGLGSDLKSPGWETQNTIKTSPRSKFYSPPESKNSPEADVFALGLILLEMVAGPVEEKSAKILLAELRESKSSPSLISLSPEQRQLVLELCEPEPLDRPFARDIFRLESYARWNHTIAECISKLD